MTFPKILSTALFCSSALITSAFITTTKAHSAACPSDATTISELSEWETVTGGDCRGTPSIYGLTVYSMGFCTANPAAGGSGATPDYSTCELTYSNTSGEYTSFAVDEISSLSAGTTTLPAANTYGYAIIKFAKTFKLKGQYGPLGDGKTYYSSGDAPNNTTGNTSTDSADLTTYDAPMNNFSGASPTVCQSISDDIDRTSLTLTGYLLDSSGDIVVNSGASGNCSGVQDVLGVAAFKPGYEVTITSATTSLTATFTVTDNGMTLYRSSDGGLTMDSGPFNVTFTIE